LFARVVIFDARRLAAAYAGQNACDGRMGPNLGARLARFAEIGDEGIGERPDRTADIAPAVLKAGRAAFERLRIDADGRRQ
jgi:hypothetical protein